MKENSNKYFKFSFWLKYIYIHKFCYGLRIILELLVIDPNPKISSPLTPGFFVTQSNLLPTLSSSVIYYLHFRQVVDTVWVFTVNDVNWTGSTVSTHRTPSWPESHLVCVFWYCREVQMGETTIHFTHTCPREVYIRTCAKSSLKRGRVQPHPMSLPPTLGSVWPTDRS